MTREEVLSFGVKPEHLKAIATYLQTNIPRPPRVADATALINNEGVLNGFLNAAKMVELLAQPEAKQDTTTPGLYSEPSRKTI